MSFLALLSDGLVANSLTILVALAAVATAYFFLKALPWFSRAERQTNRGKKFGAAETYVKVTVVYDGKPVRLLLTMRELAVAKDRAERQPEEFEDPKP